MQEGGKQYDNVKANMVRSAAHCFEAKCFGVLCSGFMDREMRGKGVALSLLASRCGADVKGQMLW